MQIITNREIKGKNFKEINKKNKIPLYLQISSMLEEAIYKQILKPNDKFLNEEKLSEYFNVSRATIRQSIGQLEKKDLVKRERALGTTVTEKKIDTGLMQKVICFTNELREKNYNFSNNIIGKKIINPTEKIKKKLNLNKGEKINYIERVRVIEGVPFDYTKIYIPIKVIKNFIEENLEESTLEIIEKKYNIYIAGVKRFLLPINYKDCKSAYKILNNPKEDAISYLETYLYSTKDELIGYYEDYFSSSKSRFELYIER